MNSTTPDNKPTMDEVTDSLTGFDEIAIEKHLGLDPYADGERKPVLYMRALAFVLARRAGASDAEAKQLVLSASLKAIHGNFDDSTPDVDPDDPATESGKDVATPAIEPGD